MKISRWKQVGFALMLAAGAAQATVVYQDDFEGPAGNATNTTPEITVAGWVGTYANTTEIDGGGKLESSNAGNAIANYRFRIATDPLTDNPTNHIISWSGTIRMPTNEWIAIGFHEINRNNMLTADINSGPFLRFTPTVTWVSPGNGVTNHESLGGTHQPGDIVSVRMDYDVQAQSVTVWMNNKVVGSNIAINHEFPVGTPADPVVYWAQVQFRNQPRAADGGAYVDDFQIEVNTRDPELVFQDDFEGAAGGVLTNSMPEAYTSGFSDTEKDMGLDGSGKLQATAVDPLAHYRFKLAGDPLTDDATITEVRWKGTVRMPANEWITIGFQGADVGNVLAATANSGPFVRFYNTGIYISPGEMTVNQEQFSGTHTAGSVIEVEAAYNVQASTMDLYFDGVPVATGVAMNHTVGGVPTDPVIDYAMIQLRNQPDVAGGGAYVDDFEVTVTRMDLAFDVIEPVEFMLNGAFNELSSKSPDDDLGGWNLAGTFGDSTTGRTVVVDNWDHWYSDPSNLIAAVGNPGVIDGIGELDGSYYLDTVYQPNLSYIRLHSSTDYRNGLMQTDILHGAAVKAGASYQVVIDVRKNPSTDLTQATFESSLTVGTGDAVTNVANKVDGSLLQIAADTLPTTGVLQPYTNQVSGADLLAAQVAGPVNMIFSQVNTEALPGFPGSVSTNDISNVDYVSQVRIHSVSLSIAESPVGDVNNDGVVDQEDVDLAQLYLDGDGGLPATNRQDILTSGSLSGAEALEALNLTDFDVDGNDTFDAADVAVIQAMATDLVTLHLVSSGGTLSFVWNCNVDKSYDIVSTTSLTSPDWQPYNDGTTTYENIAADVFGTNTVTGVLNVGPVRFFKILEK